MPIGLFGVRRNVAVPVVALIAALVAVLVWVVVGRQAAASSLPRGPVATVADRPAALNAPVVLSSINSARTSLGESALVGDSCLDAAAATFARSAADVSSSGFPSGQQSACGSSTAQAGFAVGDDTTGTSLVTSAMMRTPSGTSALVTASMKRVGFALVARRSGALVVGYALVWVVAG
jgi:hypothetical protein